MIAIDLRRSANAVQQLWCVSLLERAPRSRTFIRAYIERSRAWLANNPSRTLHAHFRDRLRSYEATFDRDDALSGLMDARPRPTAKVLPRQLTLPVHDPRRRSR